VLVLATTRSFFTFVDVDQAPVLSLLRGFSAPEVIRRPATPTCSLLRHDSDRSTAGKRPADRPAPAVRGGGAAASRGARRRLHRRDARRAAPPGLDPAFKELV
jgi:aminopeptidase N